jgi:hypothetical protein
MSSLTKHEGYLLIDHSSSPGLTEEFVRQVHLPKAAAGEGRKFETATLWCSHCAGTWIKNPDRDRPRNYCKKCDRYLCDGCAAEAVKADYVHRSFQELADLVRSGRFILGGGSPSAPILIPKTGD